MDADRFAAEAVGLHQRLAATVYAVCGDRALAEDSAQEALVRAWERVDDGEPISSLTAWSATVALNWCRTQLRRRGAESRAVARLPVPDDDELRSERVGDDVRLAVLALPDRQREVVVLHHLLDLDLASIAAVTGTSTGAVKNALFHGRAALARRLDVHDDELEGRT